MNKIIYFEFMFCPFCNYRRTIREMIYLEKKYPCPKCDQGMVGNFALFTCDPGKYKEKEKL